jgi:hypothetical protein
MVIPFLVLFLFCGTALAVSFGTDITISDRNYNDSGDSWYTNHEDDEVEPGMVRGAEWDLEGFFLRNNTLAMVGTYDFMHGNSNYMSGDIFIDVTGNAVYGDIHDSSRGDNGDTIAPVSNEYGYDYVLDMHFTTENPVYTVYAIDENTLVQQAKYNENEGSSPWRYADELKPFEDEDGKEYADIEFRYYTGQLIDELDDNMNIHNVVLVDLGFLGTDISNFTAHFTMQCGNDNLMGSTAPVPEPATLLLFGTGLIGLAGVGRKKFKK